MRVVQAAEDNDFDKLSVMDHVCQIAHNGSPEHAMLEAYTTLGYVVARTTRIRLLALVIAVVYWEPGLLAKAVTTLDVLSDGRAWLGIGAGSFEKEAHGLGLPFPRQATPARRQMDTFAAIAEMHKNTLGLCSPGWS